MSKRLEDQSLYRDIKSLRRLFRKAIFTMAKCDRSVYGSPVMIEIKDVFADFVLAYKFEPERKYYLRKLIADFSVLKIDLEDIIECGIIINPDAHTGMSLPALRMEIYKRIKDIDDAITKWCRGEG